MDHPADHLQERLRTAVLASATTLAVAESLTSGRLAQALGAVRDASEWFLGGAVVYHLDAKVRVLGIDADLDPTSAECAEQLARGVRDLYGADIAVSATGVGGPDPQDGHPPGMTYLGWACDDRAGHTLLMLTGTPDEILDATVLAALRLLVDLVEGPR